LDHGDERLFQSLIATLSPEEARKFAELDRYASQTREEVYRGFEAIDLHRHQLELARTQSEARPSEAHDWPQASAIPSRHEAFLSASSGPSPARRAVAEFAFNERHGHEPEVKKASLPGYIDSAREWHFDSLREVRHPDGIRDDETSRESLEHQISREDQSRTRDR
jgi:hypothetical protein